MCDKLSNVPCYPTSSQRCITASRLAREAQPARRASPRPLPAPYPRPLPPASDGMRSCGWPPALPAHPLEAPTWSGSASLQHSTSTGGPPATCAAAAEGLMGRAGAPYAFGALRALFGGASAGASGELSPPTRPVGRPEGSCLAGASSGSSTGPAGSWATEPLPRRGMACSAGQSRRLQLGWPV